MCDLPGQPHTFSDGESQSVRTRIKVKHTLNPHFQKKPPKDFEQTIAVTIALAEALFRSKELHTLKLRSYAAGTATSTLQHTNTSTLLYLYTFSAFLLRNSPGV